MADAAPSLSDFRVELSGIDLSLGGRSVLAGIDLTLTEHRVGIVGRNGSGKSTLARVISGLVKPDQGKAVINGVEVLRDRKAAIRTVGILFQNPDHQIIFPTVEEELAFGPRQLGQPKAEARETARTMLRRFGKLGWADRGVDTLSQGQKHLVCLMAVLVMNPAVIILDEPFTGLDIPTTRALGRYLRAVSQSLIHITHDVTSLDGYDRVLWIEQGRMHRDGPAVPVLAEYLAEMEAQDADADALLSD